MGLRYTLPPVDLRKDDLEFFETEFAKLFESECDNVASYRTKIIAVCGHGTNRVEISEKSIDELLRVAPQRKHVESLELDFHRTFKGPEKGRHLNVSIDTGERVEVSLDGSQNWINQARGLLDPRLKESSNHRKLFRWVALISLSLGIVIPIAPLEYSWIKENVDPSRYIFGYIGFGLESIVLVVIPLWVLFFRLFPLSTIALGDKLSLPWWMRGGKTVLGVIVTIVLSIIGSAIFYYPVK